MSSYVIWFLLLAAFGGQPSLPTLARVGADLCAKHDSVRALFPVLDGDAEFEVVARLFPGGFGGLTRTYFFLKEPARADSVRRMARTLAACPGDKQPDLWMVLQTVPVREGAYDWVELRKWYAVLLKVPWDGVVSGDIDEAVNRLAYGFDTQTALDAFRRRALSLGVPRAMLVLRIEKGAVSIRPRQSARPSTSGE